MYSNQRLNKKRTVTLINPPAFSVWNIKRRYLPSGLGYIASFLEKNGINVRAVDYDYYPSLLSRIFAHPKDFFIWNKYVSPSAKIADVHPLFNVIKKNLSSQPLDIVGISSITPQFNYSLIIAKAIKNINPNTIVIIGGIHPTALPEEVMEYDCFDFLVSGEGEITMLELVRAIQGGLREFDSVEGIYYRKQGKVISTKKRPIVKDLDIFPFPKREWIDVYGNKFLNTWATIITSRGCRMNCSFCSRIAIWGCQVTYHSIESILSELDYMVNKLGLYYFHFHDDFFTQNIQRTIALCKGIIDRKLKFKWWCQTRIDTINEELLRYMKQAGCVQISFGVESGDPKILKEYNKGFKLNKIIENSKMIKKSNIIFEAYMMVGHPEEDTNSFKYSDELLKKTQPDQCTTFYLLPLPGSPLYNSLRSKNKIKEKNWSMYHFGNPNLIFIHPRLSEEALTTYRLQWERQFNKGRLLKLKKIIFTTSFLSLLKSFIIRLKLFFIKYECQSPKNSSA